MLKNLFTAFALIGTFSAIAAEPAADEPVAYKLNVQNFCELVVVDGVGIDYYCSPDSAGWAVFTCKPDMASEIMFSNDNDRLTVRTAADEHAIVGVPRIRVYSASLRKVENSGDSLVRVYATVPVKEFKARQIGNGVLEVHSIQADNLDAGVTAGNGSLVISGKVKKAKLNNVSNGPVHAAGLDAANINCFVFGPGDIECSPGESLRVYGAGSGKVLYHGNPKITTRGIGVKAHPLDKETAYIPGKK